MLYVAFVDLLFHLPLAAAARGTGKAVSIQSLLLLETYLEFLILGFALYGAMRLVGGKGSVQASIAAYSRRVPSCPTYRRGRRLASGYPSCSPLLCLSFSLWLSFGPFACFINLSNARA